MTRGCPGWVVLGGGGGGGSERRRGVCSRVVVEMWRLGGCVLRVRRVPKGCEETVVDQATKQFLNGKNVQGPQVPPLLTTESPTTHYCTVQHLMSL